MATIICSNSNIFDTEEVCFSDVCRAVACDAIWRVIYIVISLLLWFRFVVNSSSGPSYERISPFSFPGHIARWMVYPLILLVLLASITEGVLSVLSFGRLGRGVLYFCVPPGITIISFLLSTYFSYKMEKRRSTKIVFALLLFWVFSAAGQIVQAPFLLPRNGLEKVPLRVVLCLTLILLYLCLAMLEIYVIVSERCHKSNNMSKDHHGEVDDGSHGTPGHIYYRLTFAWVYKVIELGNKRPLGLEDFDPVPKEISARALQDQIKTLVAKVKEKAKATGRTPSMSSVFWEIARQTVAKTLIVKIVIDLITFVQPLSVIIIIRYANSILEGVDNRSEPHYVTMIEFFQNGFVISFCTTVCMVFVQIAEQNIRFMNMRIGVNIQTSLYGWMYSKVLQMAPSCTKYGESQAGDVCSLLAVDCRIIFFFMLYCVDLVSIPLRVVISFVILWQLVGGAVIPGVILFLCATPIFFFLPKLLSSLRQQSMLNCNARIEKITELIESIRIVKMYGWEDLFSKPVLESRRREVRGYYLYRMIINSSEMTCYALASTSAVLIFATYSFFNDELVMSREFAFVAFSLLMLLRQMLHQLPMITMLLINTFSGIRRLNNILLADEVDHPNRRILENFETDTSSANRKSKNGGDHSSFLKKTAFRYYGSVKEHRESENTVQTVTHYSNLPRGIAVEINDGTFSWNQSCQTLQDVNIQFPEGQLTMITGVLGSGKSSLISAILGEIPIVRGRVSFAKRDPSLSLASQIPCILNLTIRENILFGSSYENTRYDAVIRACALDSDLSTMPAGDLTEVGEFGANLSGGQKQRINMARALYSHTEVVILDDPFSSLDAHVGNHVFKEAISKFMRNEKRTLILVTHHLQHMYMADHLVVMNNGRVEFQGSPSDISNGNYERFEEWARDYVTSGSESEWDNDVENNREKILLKKKIKRDTYNISDKALSAGDLITDEKQESGRISLSVYAYYLSSIGSVMCLLTVVFLMMTFTMETSLSLWFARWMEAAQSQFTAEDNTHFILGYACLSVGAIIFTALNLITSTSSAVKASTVIFKELLKTVVHYPIRYFDLTPVGRILTRFASDTMMLDDIAHLIVNVLFNNMSFLVVPVVINIVNTGIFSICLLPLFIILFIFMRMYLPVMREIYRCTSVSLSPVFAFFNQSSQGSSTIRAFNAKERFNKEAISRIEIFNMLYHYQTQVNGWILLRMDFVCVSLSFLNTVSALLSCIYFGLPSSYVGLVILSAFGITTNMKVIIVSLGQVELVMNSLERNKEYIDLETEPLTEGISISPDWPQTGNISFHRIYARYDESLEPVLRNITARVKTGQKVGICGRTGSGKSSLTLTLLRFIEVYQGFILIDGVDISTVPLEILRKKISTIPQNPTLFQGTIRYNLDPEGNTADRELWEALEIAQLKEFTEQLERGLDHVVSQKGSNLSVGQRQLFCLARAYLRGSKILIMDEATASVDFETDVVLQKVIRTVFADRTVLTIAHRTSSIIDSDLILVLKDGELFEYGHPNDLLAKEESAFSLLVQADKVKKNTRDTSTL